MTYKVTLLVSDSFHSTECRYSQALLPIQACRAGGGAGRPGTTVQYPLPPSTCSGRVAIPWLCFLVNRSLNLPGRRRPACQCLLTSTGGPERRLALVSMMQHSPLSLPVGRQSGRISDRSLENASDLHRPLSYKKKQFKFQ